MADERLIYSSENGDRWVLVHESGKPEAIVRHVANPSAGGQITDASVDEFMGHGKFGPEHVALCRMLSEQTPGA